MKGRRKLKIDKEVFHAKTYCFVVGIVFLVSFVFGGPITAFSIQNVSDKQIERVRKKVVTKPVKSIKMPNHSITVRANGDRGLAGRRITVRLSKGSWSRSRTVALDASGGAGVKFELGSVSAVVHGVYRVTIAKGPENSSHYASTANYCFDGTTPASRSATINSGNRHGSVVFSINASIAWNRQGYCW